MTEPAPDERPATPPRDPAAVRRGRVLLAALALLVVGAVVAVLVVFAPREEKDPVAETDSPSPSASPSVSAPPSETPTPTPTPTTPPPFDTAALSIDDPASLWVVVDKLRPLSPDDYAAPDLVDVPVPHVYAPKLRREAADQVVAMFAQFTAETGLQMQSQSAYRSSSSQVSTYNGWVAKKGQAGADLTSARPGFSEHQTGLAIDISALPAKCSLAACFADTPQGSWLAANAWKWGFVLRYPSGATPITGYEFEPWHYRYVGVALATEMHDTGVATMEEFFGLPPAPTYAG